MSKDLYFKRTQNEEDMGLKLMRGIRLFFLKKLKKTIAHPLFVFFCDAPLLLTFKECW
jgi:hypothetical protein